MVLSKSILHTFFLTKPDNSLTDFFVLSVRVYIIEEIDERSDMSAWSSTNDRKMNMRRHKAKARAKSWFQKYLFCLYDIDWQ